MSNETDVPQSAVETATLGLKNGPTDICMKDEPNEDLITTQHVKMETISTDTDVSLSDEEAGHRPRKIQYVMTSTTEDKTKDLYPFCKEIGLDLDVKSKVFLGHRQQDEFHWIKMYEAAVSLNLHGVIVPTLCWTELFQLFTSENLKALMWWRKTPSTVCQEQRGVHLRRSLLSQDKISCLPY
ncbi:hypothetical protein J4Q44_G00349940 [Coregonus suidteri]|uniref:Uncharacterized protein n=1 Tax=Coregonus suidteri TaxID=861788 RepID=A0AAN8KRI2_9TELE